MRGFEDNVPGSPRLAGDMVKDLALGTADRYWWAIAYESDALRWMLRQKPVEVWYLPRSNYADHPFCNLDNRNSQAQSGAARGAFERFLRSPSMQNLLLQNGFRPTETEVSSAIKGNPFNNPQFKTRGLRLKGFRVDDRINYPILNALNVEWSKQAS